MTKTPNGCSIAGSMNAPTKTKGFSLVGTLVAILACAAGLFISSLVLKEKRKIPDASIGVPKIEPERGLYFIITAGKEIGGWQTYIISDHEGHQIRAIGRPGILQGEEVRASSINTGYDDDELFLINYSNAN